MTTMTMPAKAAKRSIIKELYEVEKELGFVPKDLIAVKAELLDVAPRTVCRWLRNAGVPTRPKAFTFTDEVLAVVRAHGGKDRQRGGLAQAHADLAAAGVEVPTYRTFVRAYNDLPMSLQVEMEKGSQAAKAYQLYVIHETDSRNRLWYADHWFPGLFVHPPGAGGADQRSTIVRPSVTAILDDRTRLIVAVGINYGPSDRRLEKNSFDGEIFEEDTGRLVHLTSGPPTADKVAAIVVAAMQGRHVLGDGEGVPSGFYGGVPDVLAIDNGLELKSNLMRQLAQVAGFHLEPHATYTPEHSGKLERWHQTAERQCISMLPGSTLGAKTYEGKDPILQGPKLLWHEFEKLLLDWVERYNLRNVHRSLNSTPWQAWCADTRPLKRVDAADLVE